ncbi:MAG: HAD family hydrolase [Fimbriimonadaceae bacterium]
MIRAVTLDCSNTLLRDRWDPPAFAVSCLTPHYHDFDPTHAGDRYRALMAASWADYREAHRIGVAACEAYWYELSGRWLAEIGAPAALVEPTMATARQLLRDPVAGPFSLFPDTRPALDALRGAGIRLAVISNWDYSLNRTLALFGIDGSFEFTVASMMVGFDKPQPEIFEIALDRFGLRPEEVLHVGDNPVHDVIGARNVGMEALLIDRLHENPKPPVIRALTDVVSRL